MMCFIKDKGSIGELLGTAICMLALISIILAFFQNMDRIQRKSSASQIARKYMLQMECKGYLTDEDQQQLVAELEALGMEGISLEGSTLVRVGYGEEIRIHFEGTLTGGIRIAETRLSTAKN